MADVRMLSFYSKLVDRDFCVLAKKIQSALDEHPLMDLHVS
jgi:hypothetical protein